MIDTKALREKVLDLAIRGKLVPQDPTDEPASVLLERIREQKKQMVKEGKLKAKDIKDDSIIFVGDDNLHYEKFADGTVECIEDKIPFELPKGWEWVNLGTVCDVYGRIGFRGYTKGDFVSKGEGAISLSPSNIVNNSMDYEKCSYITWQKYEESPEIMIYNGDILLVKTGSSYGKSAVVYDLPEKATINPQFVVLKNSRIITSYLCYFLQSSYCISMYEKFVGGTAIPTFSQANLKAMYVAIPSIKEQSRIVNAVKIAEEQIVLIDDNSNELQTDTNLLKTKILDLAIRGKLVPQDPNDEPASVLLERIRAEKEELIKAGKIKRDKKESVIFKGEDNSYYRLTSVDKRNIIDIPFDIPDNWEWCNLSMIGSTNIGLTYKPADIVADGTMVLRSSNIINGKIDLSDLVRVNSTIRENQYIQENDILICARNGSKALVGKCAIFENVNEKASFGAFMAVYRSRFFRYVYYFLNSEFFRNTFSNDDSKQINQLTQDMIKNTAIPLPPFAEQKRIVEAIETAFAQLDEITNAIS